MNDIENLKATYSPALIFKTTVLISGKEVPQRIETMINISGPKTLLLFNICIPNIKKMGV